MQLQTLQQIRNNIAGSKNKICPKCEHELTIETTHFFETEICENCLDHAIITSINNCCKSPKLYMVKLIISNGMIQVRNQCSGCGFLEGKSIGGLSSIERDKLPMVNQNKRDERLDFIQNESKDFYNEVKRLRQAKFEKEREDKTGLWWQQYKTYLQSPEWRKKRELVLKRDNYRCQSCLTGLATQVHHTSYALVDFKGSEPCFDLTSICAACHELIHQ